MEGAERIQLEDQRKERLDRLRKRVLNVKGEFLDRRRLWTESYRRTVGQPYIFRQTKALLYLLSNVSVEIGPDELIVGRHPKRPRVKADKIWLDECERFWERQPKGFGMTGHMTINNEKVIYFGLAGIEEQIDIKLREILLSKDKDQSKIDFYYAAKLSLTAASNFISRYSREAEKMALLEKDPSRRTELRKISEICEYISHSPPRTFYEAVQLTWFLHLMIAMENGEGHGCFCPGRADQYLYAFYKSDIEEGSITPEEAKELLACLFIKYNEFDPTGSPQVLIIGGQNHDGSDATNELTYMFLDICEELTLIHPAVALSWHRGIAEPLMRKAVEVIKTGIGFPAIFNDEVIVPGLIRAGVTPEDARHYVPGSCVEISPIGCSNPWVASDYINLAKAVLLAMNNGTDPMTGETVGIQTGTPDSFKNFKQFKEAYFSQMEYMIDMNAKKVNGWQLSRKKYTPFPLLSCFVDDCIEKGADITSGGARYNLVEPEGVGLPNATDSLMAIKKLVFENGEYTLGHLTYILSTDFKGYEDLKNRIINRLPKYGNDDDEVDSMASEIATRFYDEVEKYRSPIGGKYYAGFLCWIMHHILGFETSATPDGRNAGEVLADSIGAVQGRDSSGPTAVIKSATKFDHSRAIGGLALNLKFIPSVLETEDGIGKFISLIETYLRDLGGFEIQINIVDKNTLIEAQKNPEKYRNLTVRVGGFSAYFVTLDRRLQDEIIARTAHEI